MSSLKEICEGIQTDPLPEPKERDERVPHAPIRTPNLTKDEQKLALRNALRYFPTKVHETLVHEFADELRNYGHIYMYRFRPTLEMRAYPLNEYPAVCPQAAAIMHMIMNNLDPRVAQFPHELVTYGGNGQVFSNWAQFLLAMKYLSEMTEEQTLVLYSGHPMGLFPSQPESPRAIITNGMVIPNYSSRDMYEKMFALGVSILFDKLEKIEISCHKDINIIHSCFRYSRKYGQMTAGSYCYIGPQGIVHGTTLTVLNAARNKLGTSNLAGKVFVTSGLGGMSGAQAKAAVICGCIGVIAEVSKDALYKRYNQGWVMEVTNDIEQCIVMIKHARREKTATSIGYHGNIVDIWERLVQEYDTTGELLVDLGSDQTSCHNPYLGGYYPAQLTYDESLEMMHEDPVRFKNLVKESLRRHIAAINRLSDGGLYFWDYGNAFLLEAGRAGADVGMNTGLHGTFFRYPSYVQDIMGDIFSLGFGPFRWVCTSTDPNDLDLTDDIATSVMEDIINEGVKENVKQQYNDNIRWIKEAARNNMVVGSKARILYADDKGRAAIAVAFNKAIAEGKLKSPVVISRDHHDVSGTDSPYRETSNIYDGSAFCADMAVQNAVGDAFRGATWVALHNGGGVGWGEVMNGGFGLVLDGSNEAGERAKRMLSWDVSNGVARRSWSGNTKAKETICRIMEDTPNMKVTIANSVDDDSLLERAIKD